MELLADDPRAAELARSVKTIAELLTSIGWSRREQPRSSSSV
ncbi:hypothetical protein [Streptomyces sp. NPDC047841]